MDNHLPTSTMRKEDKEDAQVLLLIIKSSKVIYLNLLNIKKVSLMKENNY